MIAGAITIGAPIVSRRHRRVGIVTDVRRHRLRVGTATAIVTAGTTVPVGTVIAATAATRHASTVTGTIVAHRRVSIVTTTVALHHRVSTATGMTAVRHRGLIATTTVAHHRRAWIVAMTAGMIAARRRVPSAMTNAEKSVVRSLVPSATTTVAPRRVKLSSASARVAVIAKATTAEPVRRERLLLKTVRGRESGPFHVRRFSADNREILHPVFAGRTVLACSGHCTASPFSI